MTVPPFPWIFPYVEDPVSATRYGKQSGRDVFRPLLEVSLPGMEQKIPMLVDSGSEHTLILKWVARAVGLDFKSGGLPEVVLALGGETIRMNLVSTMIRLHPPGGGLTDYVEWEAEIGVVEKWKPSWSGLLGQIGFFDRWTVTMQRAARTVVVEEMNAFDERFGIRLDEAEAARHRTYP